MALGAPSVMTSGTTEMLVWCADNWDTLLMVKQSWYTYNLLIQIFVPSSIQNLASDKKGRYL